MKLLVVFVGVFALCSAQGGSGGGLPPPPPPTTTTTTQPPVGGSGGGGPPPTPPPPGPEPLECLKEKRIPKEKICDGVEDCLLGQDEKKCGQPTTTEPPGGGSGSPPAPPPPPEPLYCLVEITVPYEKVCDGFEDCEWGGDEKWYCAEKLDLFFCDDENVTMINKSLVCDDQNDCPPVHWWKDENVHLDELTYFCLNESEEFACGPTTKIDLALVCDQVSNCPFEPWLGTSFDEAAWECCDYEYQFPCSPTKCLNDTQFCDGVGDCGSDDEMPFARHFVDTFNMSSWYCLDGTKIPASEVGDGVQNCKDTDEAWCEAGSGSGTTTAPAVRAAVRDVSSQASFMEKMMRKDVNKRELHEFMRTLANRRK